MATARIEALEKAWEHFSVKHGITGNFEDAGWGFGMGFTYGFAASDQHVAIVRTRLANSRSQHRNKYKLLRARTRKTIAGLTAALSRRKDDRQRSYARIKKLEEKFVEVQALADMAADGGMNTAKLVMAGLIARAALAEQEAPV
jgi:hypothetical protein